MSGRLDRPYPADEQLALARQRLGPVSAALPAMVAVASLLRILRAVLTESGKQTALRPPFSTLLEQIARFDDDVRRLFETPLLPGLDQFKGEHLDAYGDRYDLAARIPDALPAVVQLVMFGLELLRCEAKTKVTIGQPDEWAALRADLTDLMTMCAFGPLETKEGGGDPLKDSLAERTRHAGVEPDHPWPRTSHRPAPPLEPPPAGYVPTPPPGPVVLTPPHAGRGATCYVPKHEHNAAIIERIVADRVRDAHLLRCIVQGCHCKTAGAPCDYCGTVRG